MEFAMLSSVNQNQTKKGVKVDQESVVIRGKSSEAPNSK